MRSAHANPDEGGIPPIRLAWTEAQANLGRAVGRAEARAPALAPLLREWADALERLAARGPAGEVRLDVTEFSNFYSDADAFLAEVRRGVNVWHGDEAPDLPEQMDDAGRDLTGFDERTDEPFPRSMPEWRAGRPMPGASPQPQGGRQRLGEWGMVGLCVAIAGGASLVSRGLFGSPTPGLVIGLVLAAVLVWRWASQG